MHVYQSINQSFNLSINQSINQPSFARQAKGTLNIYTDVKESSQGDNDLVLRYHGNTTSSNLINKKSKMGIFKYNVHISMNEIWNILF